MGKEHTYFKGKVVIVTGSSNGIGRAAAVLFADNGAKVVIHGRDTNALAETKRQILATGTPQKDVLEVVGDLTDENVTRSIVSKTVEAFGTIHILINNAGSATETAFSPETLSEFDWTMNLNARAVLLLSQLALPELIKNKGEIVNISSVGAYHRSFPMPYYAVAKAALDQVTTQLATHYIKEGVRVNGINPGLVETTIMQKRGFSEAQVKQLSAACQGLIPVGRVGEPKDIAELIAFLANRDKSGYIVGQNIAADGGGTLYVNLFDKLGDVVKQAAAAAAQKK